jgi:tRNA(fMet)-specific endonuclease VapC
VAASPRRSGRNITARAFDAILASIALANELDVFTSNPKDVDGIEGLGVVALPHP